MITFIWDSWKNLLGIQFVLPYVTDFRGLVWDELELVLERPAFLLLYTEYFLFINFNNNKQSF